MLPPQNNAWQVAYILAVVIVIIVVVSNVLDLILR